jgi:uncharacterized membrane protein YdbT with pleckstrin-like domain
MSTERPIGRRPPVCARWPLTPAWVIVLLAGPVIWYLYFWAVYLAAEAMCAGQSNDDSVVLGVPLVSALVVLATVVAVVPIGWFALRARRVDPNRGHREQLARTGAMLGFVFVFATLFVGLPAVFLPPC